MSVSAGLQIPREGDVVSVRQRRWLVGGVVPWARPGDATLVRLSCLDVDAAGEPLEVLWEIEVDAEVIPERAALLDDVGRLDAPAVFGAYLNSLLWDCVTSTDKRLLQAHRQGLLRKTLRDHAGPQRGHDQGLEPPARRARGGD